MVEENGDDAFIIQRAFRGMPYCTSFVCRNGSEARSYFLGEKHYSDRLNFPLPDGVILGFRYGTDSGLLEFIKWIADSPDWAGIPVVILTGGTTPKDVDTAFRVRAKQVLAKPTGMEALKEMLTELAREMCGKAGEGVNSKG